MSKEVMQECGCDSCGGKKTDGWLLYCLACLREEKEWVGLTDEEIAEAIGAEPDDIYLADFRKVEAKLKEKNT